MTEVIINDVPPKTRIFATAGQIIFDTDWTADVASDVIVFQRATGVDADDLTQQLMTSQYNVTFVGNGQLVRVTLIIPAALDDVVTIIRATPADRENHYTNTNFIPSMLNNDFGIMTLVDQQNKLMDQRINPHYNLSETLVAPRDVILPILQPDEIWIMNSAHTQIIAGNVVDLTTGTTEVDTGIGLTGGPITTTGTISFADIPPNTFLGNITGIPGPPIPIPLSNIILPPSVANQMLISIAPGPDTYTWIGPANDSVLITGGSSVPQFDTTLPTIVQDNITRLGVQAPTKALRMGNFFIHDVINPNFPQDAATKNYTDTIAADLNVVLAVYSATTANLTATYNNAASGVGATLTNAGPLVPLDTDGITPPLNARVLVKNQTLTFQNGIYVQTTNGTSWVLTRPADYDQPSEIKPGNFVLVNNGNTQAATSWIETATVVNVGSDPVLYNQFTFNVSNVLKKSLNLSDVQDKTLSFNNISPLTTKGDLISRNSTNNIRVPVGSVNGEVLQVNSATASGLAWSTTTYPVTTTVNELLYSSATNAVTGLATANNGVLITSNIGIPSWLPNGTAGQVLTANTGAPPSWTTVALSGFLLPANNLSDVNSASISLVNVSKGGYGFVGISTTTALTSAEFGKEVICTGAVAYTVTLPTAGGNAEKFLDVSVRTTSFAIVTFVPAAGTIMGVTAFPLGPNENCRFVTDGTNWYVTNLVLQPVSFNVWANATQGAGGATRAALTQIEWDLGGFFDVGPVSPQPGIQHTYTPRYVGTYFFSGSVYLTASFLFVFNVSIRKNGSALIKTTYVSNNVANFVDSCTVTTYIKMNGVADRIGLYINGDGTHAVQTQAGIEKIYLTGYRISNI